MSTQQVNGNPSTVSSSNNNGGSVINGGSSTVLNPISLGYSDTGVFGSYVIDGDSADKVLTAGVFSYNNQRPVAKRTTKELAGGVANDVLLSGAAQPGLIRSINKLEVLRTRRLATAIRAGKWNIFKGRFLNNQNQAADNPVVAVDTLEPDTEANVSRTSPGGLVYKTGSPVPFSDQYKPKTA